MTTNSENPYKNAGVDTERGDALADWLADRNSKFIHPKGLGRIASGIGGFAGLFDLNVKGMKQPQLVASTDGVGTKLLLGLQHDMIDHLGQDLVAMCANDLYTIGATPLFFLDYYATGVLSETQFKRVLTSIQNACKHCQMGLLGGETAEMPGLYEKGHFDLAGFVVGIVDAEKRLGPHKTKLGDRLIAWQSSGFHSNGYSLIRKWLKENPKLADSKTISHLMTPTKLYPEVVTLAESFEGSFHAAANITGGGISGNLPRVIGSNLNAKVDFARLPTDSWITQFIHNAGAKLKDVEPVFNLGAGMICIVDADHAARFIEASNQLGLNACDIGSLISGSGESQVLFDY